MRTTRRTLSFTFAFAIALGILFCPLFANKTNAAQRTEYTGIEIIDDFLNDPRWAEGVEWDSSTTSKLSSASGTGCYAYVCDYVKYCFGYNYPESGDLFYDINEVRVGDVVAVGNPNTGSVGHWFIVIKRQGESIIIAEGNAMDQVLMEREFIIEDNHFIGDREGREFLKGYHFIDIVTGWQVIDGKTYYFDDSGNKVTGWQKIGRNTYYFDKDGVMQTGWQVIDGNKFYLGDDGVMRISWQLIDEDWYYFYRDGKMATGWLFSGSDWYYLDKATGAAVTGWLFSGNDWYYMNADCSMATGWVKSGGKWYYMRESGAMATGWIKSGGNWYYLSRDNGDMLTGWILSGGDWYYLNESGAMITGWRYSGDSWYYFDDSGAMVTGSYTVNGIDYEFDDSGRLIEEEIS